MEPSAKARAGGYSTVNITASLPVVIRRRLGRAEVPLALNGVMDRIPGSR
jgi:hypothetical protein